MMDRLHARRRRYPPGPNGAHYATDTAHKHRQVKISARQTVSGVGGVYQPVILCRYNTRLDSQLNPNHNLGRRSR